MADVLDIENSEEFEVDEDGERTSKLLIRSNLIHYSSYSRDCMISTFS